MELRRRGFAGRVMLIGAESYLPYDRTLLSKDLLRGTVEPMDLQLASEAEYCERGIELRLGTPAAALCPERHELTLLDGTVVAYDQLVIATGGRPARPATLCDTGAHVLRTLDDALALRETLSRCRQLVVVGGGFIGAEVAATARTLGLDVTIIEASKAPLSRAIGAQAGQRIASLHRRQGVTVVTKARARAVRRGVHASLEVRLEDERILTAEAVVVGAGIVPQADWLRGSGVQRKRWIVVDELCRTSACDVLAAGDCTSWSHPHVEDPLHVKHWDMAGRHGAAAARTALGEDEPFASAPFFWSSQYGIRFQWVGHGGWDSVEIQDGPTESSFTARYEKEGRLVAAFAARNPRAIAAARQELEANPEVVR